MRVRTGRFRSDFPLVGIVNGDPLLLHIPNPLLLQPAVAQGALDDAVAAHPPIAFAAARARIIQRFFPRLETEGPAVALGRRTTFLNSASNLNFRPSDIMVGAADAIHLSAREFLSHSGPFPSRIGG